MVNRASTTESDRTLTATPCEAGAGNDPTPTPIPRFPQFGRCPQMVLAYWNKL